MKYFTILILIGFVGTASVNIVHGMWFPQSPEDLFEQSETVFVGTVSSVNVLEFERSNTYHIEENGVSRIEIENYTQTLDEYTVDVEEFLKNPQKSNKITMLEATVGGVPGRSVSIGGFELGDRVLFYVPNVDGTNQYSPESFVIPRQCDARLVLEQPKITLANDFKMMQEGIPLRDNFTANKPIQFVYDKDMRTLDGKSFDVNISISKTIGNDRDIVIKESIHAESEPCEWIATASWEFVPTAGGYSMWMHTSEGNSTDGETSSSGFTVLDDISSSTESIFPLHGYQAWKVMPPLKQIQYGIPIDEIECKMGLQKMLKHDGTPACVTSSTAPKLSDRGWSWVLDLELWAENYLIIPAIDYEIKTDEGRYGSQYMISGAVIDGISYDQHANSLIVLMNSPERGILQIVIPSGLLHSVTQTPFSYFVLVNGEEIEYEKLSPIILKIPFDSGTERIEIIGTFMQQ